MTIKLQITTPDDWHLHLRDGPVMQSVLSHTSFWCKRAIVMPNLVPPVVTAALLLPIVTGLQMLLTRAWILRP